MLSAIYSKILEVVILVIIVLISRYLVPLVKKHLNFTKLEEITDWAFKFVNAAENIYTEAKSGDIKLSTVLGWLDTKAKSIGLDLNEDELRAIIECAINDMKKGE